MRTDISNESDPDEMLTHDLVWLVDVLEDNHSWLQSNPEKVYAIIRAGLRSDYHYARTVEVIVGFIAPVVADDTWKPWFAPIVEIVETHLTRASHPFETGLRGAMAKFRVQVGVFGRLNQVRPAQIDALLQAYIELFRTVIYMHGLKLQKMLIDQAVTVAQHLDDHVESSRLYQTLALYYFHAEDASLAKSYAKLALSEYEFIEDSTGALDAALTMAAICRGSLRYNRAEYFIKRVIDMHLPLQRDKRLATLFYEYAANSYLNDRFDIALSYYQRALAIFEEHDAQFQITMTHQAMAQVYIHLGDFPKAEALLLDARKQWEVLGNQYEWVNTFFVEADLELKRGNRTLGWRLLRHTTDLAYTLLEDTPRRDTLLRLIQEYRDARIPAAAG